MDSQSQRAVMSQSQDANGNNEISDKIDQGDESQDGSSLGESQGSERENVDDDDVFGSLLSWEDEDLRSISVSDNASKGNLPNSIEPASADGEDECSNKGNEMESHGNLSRNQVLDIMFGFGPPPVAANEMHDEGQSRIDQLQQSPTNQAMTTKKRAGITNTESASMSSSVFSSNNSSLDLIFPQVLQQHQYIPPQSFFAVPQQGMCQSQDVQNHLTTSPMMNASLGTISQSIQQPAFNQGFHLPNSVINVLGGQQDQQQQGSPIMGPTNPCLSSLPMQVMQFSKQVPLVLLPSQQDLQLQAESESQDRLSLFPLPHMVQQNPVLAVMLPGQNAVAVPQQDMWKLFQHKTSEISQWLTPNMQPCPQHNTVIPNNIVVPGSDGGQTLVMPSPGESYALPVQQESTHPVQRKRPSLPAVPASEEKNEKKVRNHSEPSLPRSHTVKNNSSNSLQPGRYGRGRGRYFVKTLLPLISDLTSDSKSAKANLRTENGRMTESTLGLSNADTSGKDKLVKPAFTQETHSRPAKIAKHSGKSIPQPSKASAISTASSNRRKSTSLAHEATLAMNVAKEEEQKEKLVSQQKEQLKHSGANMMQSPFPIVSNDEMSDTSFRRQVLSDGELMGHAGRVHPSLNLMCPPPPSNPSVVNSRTTWKATNAALDTVEGTGSASKSHKVDKRANKSKKQTELSTQDDQVDAAKKMLASSSLHDAVLSSETDGGFTTDPEKESSNCPATDLELSEGDRSRLHRDRNKEHARNTRLRKKAYVEKLRATVDDLCRERDSLVQDRATSASRLLEQQKIRIDVLLAYFALRRQCERRRDLWAGVCEESVICTLPITPYRSFPAYEVQASKLQRTIQGIDGLIADTVSFHVLLDSLIDFNSVFNPRSPYYALHAVHTTPHTHEGSPKGVTPPPLLISSASPKIQVQYTVITEDASPGGSQIMARWTMVTLNAVALGAPFELTNNCMVCAKFSSANKIVSLDHVFDGLAFMLQLMPKSLNNGQMLPSTLSSQNTGLPADLLASSNPFKVVPNTVQVSQRNYDVPMVLTLAERPYTIMQVNSHWEEMTGFKAEEVVGKSNARIMQPRWQQIPNFPAPYQDPALSFLMMEVRMKRAATATLINVNARGDLFRNVLQVYPLCTDGKVTHYLGLTIFKQSLGINWNTFTQNPVNIQQVVQPLHQAPIVSSSSIDLMHISVQGGLSQDSKEKDSSQRSHVQPDEAKISSGIA